MTLTNKNVCALLFKVWKCEAYDGVYSKDVDYVFVANQYKS